ncbi:5-deoxy-glucuronate isomerase [Paenibacillus azoreducens]|uniref:5-deoxy-glucuronate isomerase n=1 Tax=Paenibacillus azoreducens TaxID=116718 RepID=UPI0039F452C6
MVQLQRTPIRYRVSDGVTLLHHITQANAPLSYIETQVYELAAGASIQLQLTTHELCIVALTGKYSISDGEQRFEHVGTRDSVFEKVPTDSVYVPAGKQVSICCEKAGKVVLAYAPTEETGRQTTLIPASSNSTESRGKYNNQRLVHNILDDQSKIADKLLVVEVYTETANWSSYPPHKHDQDNLPEESFLEETYYHEINPRQGYIMQRVYTDDRLLDESMSVHNEDIVIVPKGYHPVGVPDGYESYYLNIMAGPTKVWKFNNDKDHEWILKRP